jgi:AcrR family transcriptional regulator
VRSNPRMLFHYFGSKSQLYVAVLEEALAGLRRREVELDVEHLDPREGLLQLFDFLLGRSAARAALLSSPTASSSWARRSPTLTGRSQELWHKHCISRGPSVCAVPPLRKTLRSGAFLLEEINYLDAGITG